MFGLTMLVSAPAHAQHNVDIQSVAPASSSSDAVRGSTDDIIVTALRSETTASQTPVALTAIKGAALRSAGVTDVSTLDELVPNLSIDRDNGIQITIRGVTSSDGTEKGDPSAAFLLDGVYIARPQAQDVSFFDIERVEVLRGPQGTLYGRNTTAGVINLISATPKHDFGASADLSYGNFDAINATAMVNAPVTDTIALRGAVNYDRRDSFIRRGAGGAPIDPARDTIAARLSAAVDLTPAVALILRADYAEMKGAMPNSVALENFFAGPFSPDHDPVPISLGSKRQRTLTWPERETERDNRSWGASAELNWDAGPVAVTYLGSYREFRRREVSSFLFGLNTTTYDGDYWQNSQELRIAFGKDTRLHGQVGAYYFKERSAIAFFVRDPVGLPVPPNTARYGFAQKPTIAEAYAGFGQITYDLTPALHVTAGIRYSHDLKSRLGGTLLAFPGGPELVLERNDARRNFDRTTWRLGLDYDAPGLGLLYATVSTGYKAGGFNDGCEAASGNPACNRPVEALYYRPETLTAYEAGFKFRLADGAVRINGAAFHYDYKDLQLSQNSDICGGPCQVTTNAARAKVDGIELESVIQLHPQHRIELGANYLDARYARYFPTPAVSFAGKPLDRSPKFTASAGYSFTQPLGNGGSIVASGRVRFSDDYVVTDLGPRIQFRQPHYHKTDLTLTYQAPAERFYVQAYVRNLENEVTLSTATTTFGALASFADPRTYGIRLGARY